MAIGDSTSKYIADMVNKWVGEETPFNEKEVFNFIWALSMDNTLFTIVQAKIALLCTENFLVREDAEKSEGLDV